MDILIAELVPRLTWTVPFIVIQVLGTIAFAISGVIAAARAQMDWLGAIVLATVVAVGGGTMRDLLMGNLPVFWIKDAWAVWVAIATALLVILILRWRPFLDPSHWRSYLIADAAGLSAFVIVGADVALQAGLNGFFAVILGALTGAGGGVIRDILTGHRPIVLVGQIYVLAGIIGATLYALLIAAGFRAGIPAWIAMLVIFAIRMFSIHRNWSLPLVGSGNTAGVRDTA